MYFKESLPKLIGFVVAINNLKTCLVGIWITTH